MSKISCDILNGNICGDGLQYIDIIKPLTTYLYDRDMFPVKNSGMYNCILDDDYLISTSDTHILSRMKRQFLTFITYPQTLNGITITFTNAKYCRPVAIDVADFTIAEFTEASDLNDCEKKDLKDLSSILTDDKARLYLDIDKNYFYYILKDKDAEMGFRNTADVCKIIALIDKLINKTADNSKFTNEFSYDDNLYKSLYADDKESYLELYTNWVTETLPKLKAKKLNQSIEKLDNVFAKRRSIALRNELNGTNELIKQTESDLRDLYNTRERLLKKIIVAEYYKERDDTTQAEFIKLLTTSKNIVDVKMLENILVLDIVTPLINYDVDLATRWCKETNNAFQRHKNLVPILKTVLCGETYSFMFQCTIHIDIPNKTFECERNRNNYKPYGTFQPHLDGFNCFGDNKSVIADALTSGDMVTALYTILSATGSFNILDGSVCDKFLNGLDEVYEYIIEREMTDLTYNGIYNNKENRYATLQEVLDYATANV